MIPVGTHEKQMAVPGVALRRRKFTTLPEVVKRTLFRDHELNTKIVVGLEFLADRLLRLLVSQ